MCRTRIKICGITRREDATAAVEAGADAIGMILHADSPRKIWLDRAMEIVDTLPPFVMPVGVFVDASVELILEIARTVGFNHVQLHGKESPEIMRKLTGAKVIKVFRLDEQIEDELSRWKEASKKLSAIIIEKGAGSGIENDWNAIADLRSRHAVLQNARFIAAGGLNSMNVGNVVARIRPWAVDVSSGVEESLGIKSTAKIREFCESVRLADAV